MNAAKGFGVIGIGLAGYFFLHRFWCCASHKAYHVSSNRKYREVVRLVMASVDIGSCC